MSCTSRLRGTGVLIAHCSGPNSTASRRLDAGAAATTTFIIEGRRGSSRRPVLRPRAANLRGFGRMWAVGDDAIARCPGVGARASSARSRLRRRNRDKRWPCPPASRWRRSIARRGRAPGDAALRAPCTRCGGCLPTSPLPPVLITATTRSGRTRTPSRASSPTGPRVVMPIARSRTRPPAMLSALAALAALATARASRPSRCPSSDGELPHSTGSRLHRSCRALPWPRRPPFLAVVIEGERRAGRAPSTRRPRPRSPARPARSRARCSHACARRRAARRYGRRVGTHCDPSWPGARADRASRLPDAIAPSSSATSLPTAARDAGSRPGATRARCVQPVVREACGRARKPGSIAALHAPPGRAARGGGADRVAAHWLARDRPARGGRGARSAAADARRRVCVHRGRHLRRAWRNRRHDAIGGARRLLLQAGGTRPPATAAQRLADAPTLRPAPTVSRAWLRDSPLDGRRSVDELRSGLDPGERQRGDGTDRLESILRRWLLPAEEIERHASACARFDLPAQSAEHTLLSLLASSGFDFAPRRRSPARGGALADGAIRRGCRGWCPGATPSTR